MGPTADYKLRMLGGHGTPHIDAEVWNCEPPSMEGSRDFDGVWYNLDSLMKEKSTMYHVED